MAHLLDLSLDRKHLSHWIEAHFESMQAQNDATFSSLPHPHEVHLHFSKIRTI